ncbi:hypothetical protein MsAg5_08610 [Methanosarcinaceae archaeon Ag5]|uniref:Uncharacterized protein n=1 Tax=Methanolapillus africanus TaxID=3028297 RepID=A0AAE4SDV9_9EURY|nr:hypothetical protein [Methanosarcinaceae archaeon Ag5]
MEKKTKQIILFAATAILVVALAAAAMYLISQNNSADSNGIQNSSSNQTLESVTKTNDNINYSYLRGGTRIVRQFDPNDFVSRPHVTYPPESAPPWTEKGIMDDADLIVRGTVVQVQPDRWDTPDGTSPVIRTPNFFSVRGEIYHLIVVDVEEVYKGELKGAVDGKIYIRQMGGADDGVSMDVGLPDYRENESVILCLTVLPEIQNQAESVHYNGNPGGVFFVVNETTCVNGYNQKANLEEVFVLLNVSNPYVQF